MISILHLITVLFFAATSLNRGLLSCQPYCKTWLRAAHGRAVERNLRSCSWFRQGLETWVAGGGEDGRRLRLQEYPKSIGVF